LQQGDKIMLCSDGLWGTLSDADIVRQLARSRWDAVPELVERRCAAAATIATT
jgi:serine/threonine protein phosphatase PrpC